MIITTKAQRKALFRVFQRDFPSWTSPGRRTALNTGVTLAVPTIQWRRFRKTVQGGPGCIMLPWKGMWLGIEPDGYTHS